MANKEMTPTDKESAELRMMCQDVIARITASEYQLLPTDTEVALARALLQRLPAESAQGEDDYMSMAFDLINHAVEIMTPEQVGQLAGVRWWLENFQSGNITNYKALWEACHVKHEAERNRRMELERESMVCTGCGHDRSPVDPKYLGCCPDSRYRTAKEILAELWELKREGYALEWQPIETAPKGEYETYLVANAIGQVAPIVRGIVQNNVGTRWDWNKPATHWMPLPAAPTPEGK